MNSKNFVVDPTLTSNDFVIDPSLQGQDKPDLLINSLPIIYRDYIQNHKLDKILELLINIFKLSIPADKKNEIVFIIIFEFTNTSEYDLETLEIEGTLDTMGKYAYIIYYFYLLLNISELPVDLLHSGYTLENVTEYYHKLIALVHQCKYIDDNEQIIQQFMVSFINYSIASDFYNNIKLVYNEADEKESYPIINYVSKNRDNDPDSNSTFIIIKTLIMKFGLDDHRSLYTVLYNATLSGNNESAILIMRLFKNHYRDAIDSIFSNNRDRMNQITENGNLGQVVHIDEQFEYTTLLSINQNFIDNDILPLSIHDLRQQEGVNQI